MSFRENPFQPLYKKRVPKHFFPPSERVNLLEIIANLETSISEETVSYLLFCHFFKTLSVEAETPVGVKHLHLASNDFLIFKEKEHFSTEQEISIGNLGGENTEQKLLLYKKLFLFFNKETLFLLKFSTSGVFSKEVVRTVVESMDLYLFSIENDGLFVCCKSSFGNKKKIEQMVVVLCKSMLKGNKFQVSVVEKSHELFDELERELAKSLKFFSKGLREKCSDIKTPKLLLLDKKLSVELKTELKLLILTKMSTIESKKFAFKDDELGTVIELETANEAENVKKLLYGRICDCFPLVVYYLK